MIYYIRVFLSSGVVGNFGDKDETFVIKHVVGQLFEALCDEDKLKTTLGGIIAMIDEAMRMGGTKKYTLDIYVFKKETSLNLKTALKLANAGKRTPGKLELVGSCTMVVDIENESVEIMYDSPNPVVKMLTEIFPEKKEVDVI